MAVTVAMAGPEVAAAVAAALLLIAVLCVWLGAALGAGGTAGCFGGGVVGPGHFLLVVREGQLVSLLCFIHPAAEPSCAIWVTR